MWTRYPSVLSFGSILGLAVGIGTAALLLDRPEKPASNFRFQGPTVTELERLTELATMRVQVSDVLVGRDHDYKGCWLVHGDALVAIDLGQATIPPEQLNLADRRARIVLPAPRVIQPRVDHERTLTWDVRKTSWIPLAGDPDQLRDEAMQQAQRLVEHAAGSPENLKGARTRAELLLQSFFAALNWKVEVVWAEP